MGPQGCKALNPKREPSSKKYVLRNVPCTGRVTFFILQLHGRECRKASTCQGHVQVRTLPISVRRQITANPQTNLLKQSRCLTSERSAAFSTCAGLWLTYSEHSYVLFASRIATPAEDPCFVEACGNCFFFGTA